MKRLSIIYLFLCCHLVWGQSKYFEKKVSWLFNQNGQVISELANGNYSVIGVVEQDAYTWNGFNLMVDKFGNVVDTIFYNSPSNYATSFFQSIPTESGFSVIGQLGTNAAPVLFGSYLLQLDDTGNMLDSLWIVSPDENISNINVSYTLCRTPDGGYMIGGRARVGIGVGSTHYPYLMRLDAAGNMLWDTVYQINGWQGSTPTFYSIIRDANNDTYYANAGVHTFDNSDDVVWCHIDGNGNILQQRTFGNEEDYTDQTPGLMIRSMDGNFIMPYTITENGIRVSGQLIKYDAILDSIIWKKEVFPLSYIRLLKELPDGSFIVAGSASESMDNLPFQAAIAHVSAEGEVLWRRLYGSEGYPDYLYDFIITSDGSYFFVGRAETNSTADVYLLKTNCMGLLTEPQAAFAATIDTAALTVAFHNLSQFVYPDSADGGHFIWDFGDGTFSSDTNPTHAYTQAGEHEVRLSVILCQDTTVFVQQVSTWAVGISPPPLVSETPLNDQLFKVLPNPAQDYLVVENHSSEQNVTFVLYDVMGKEVARQALSVNSTTVKTEHLPSGVYLYHILNPQKQILTYGKVSIVR